MENFIVTCAPGLETLLIEEIEELGLSAFSESLGSVSMSGNVEHALKVAFHSRIASRVLWALKKFSARNAEMLYDQVRRINWPKIFSSDQTFMIQSHGQSVEGLKTSFTSLKIKDAICDEFKKHGFERPNVDRAHPDFRIEAFFYAGKCQLSIDLFGEALHRRSHKEENADAPLRENRAAALLRFAGYKGDEDFCDPVCGSGTLLSEAALIALNIAPGMARNLDPEPAFKIFPEAKGYWLSLIADARKQIKSKPSHLIMGSDNNTKQVRICLQNLENLRLGKHVKVLQQDALKLAYPVGLIASNPPFGDRLMTEETAAELLKEFCSKLKHNAKGSKLALFLKKGPLEKAPGLRTKRKMTVKNGPLETKFLLYELF